MSLGLDFDGFGLEALDEIVEDAVSFAEVPQPTLRQICHQ